MTHFGFALDLSDIDLWNIDLLDTHLDLLDTDITSKNFVCLRDVFKTFSRYVFQTSSRQVFKTCLQYVLKKSSALQYFVFQDVLKTSSRSLEDQQMFAGGVRSWFIGLLYCILWPWSQESDKYISKSFVFCFPAKYLILVRAFSEKKAINLLQNHETSSERS